MKKYTEEIKQKIVNEYVNTIDYNKSVKELSKKYEIGIKSISNWIKEAGYEIYNSSHHTYINETIFDVIDTEEKAYWLGFIYADGCIYSKEKRFELELAIKDYGHLLKFAKFLESRKTNPIKLHNNVKNGKLLKQCRIQFRSEHVWKALNDKGCVPNKTLILKFPDTSIFADKKLIRDFMRGYIDGDGCLYLYKRKKSYPCLQCLGTKEFLLEFIQQLPISYKNTKKINHPPKYKNTWSLHIWKEAIQCLHFLYKDSSIYLDRKYQKYKEICRLCEQSHRLLQGKNGED